MTKPKDLSKPAVALDHDSIVKLAAGWIA